MTCYPNVIRRQWSDRSRSWIAVGPGRSMSVPRAAKPAPLRRGQHAFPVRRSGSWAAFPRRGTPRPGTIDDRDMDTLVLAMHRTRPTGERRPPPDRATSQHGGGSNRYDHPPRSAHNHAGPAATCVADAVFSQPCHDSNSGSLAPDNDASAGDHHASQLSVASRPRSHAHVRSDIRLYVSLRMMTMCFQNTDRCESTPEVRLADSRMAAMGRSTACLE
jgi:hypothetical protein